MNGLRNEPKLTEIPPIPPQFGEDGGHFYRYYDAVADELDEDMVKSLKSQLDGILIFAGLFAGVNSAFLALTLPDMKPDPADDTNALLLRLVTGDNTTIRSADDLPSAAFAPPAGVLPVNVLFSLSLTLAIISSFLAVLGQQWLVYYRKQSGGGPESQRWEQLRRYLGGERWHMREVLDFVLPALLQSALVIFCVAFAIYSRSLSTTVYYTVSCPMLVAAATLLLTAVVAVWDPWCPFKSPLSQALQLIGRVVSNNIVLAVLLKVQFFNCLIICGALLGVGLFAFRVIRNGLIFLVNKTLEQSERRTLSSISMLTAVLDCLAWIFLAFSRHSGEAIEILQSAAVKRVLSTSEDYNTLIYTAINMKKLLSSEAARHILSDDAVWSRMHVLSSDDRPDIRVSFRMAFAHLLSESRIMEFYFRKEDVLAPLKPPKRHIGLGKPDYWRKINWLGIFEIKSFSDSEIDSIKDLDPILFMEVVYKLFDGGTGLSSDLLDWLECLVGNYWPPGKECPPSTTLLTAYVARRVKLHITSGDAESDLSESQERPLREARDLITLERDPQRAPATWLKGVKEALEGSYPDNLARPPLAEVDLWLLEQTFRIFKETDSFRKEYWDQCSSLIAQRSIFLINLFSKELPHPSHLIRSITILSNLLDHERRNCAEAIEPILEDLLGLFHEIESWQNDEDALIIELQSACLKMRASLLDILGIEVGPKYRELRPKFEAAFDQIELAMAGHRDKHKADQDTPVNLDANPADPPTVIVEMAEEQHIANPNPAVNPLLDAHEPLLNSPSEPGDLEPVD